MFCKYCNTEITGKNKKYKKFCCVACYLNSLGYKPRYCKYCGKELVKKKRANSKYCSRTCYILDGSFVGDIGDSVKDPVRLAKKLYNSPDERWAWLRKLEWQEVRQEALLIHTSLKLITEKVPIEWFLKLLLMDLRETLKSYGYVYKKGKFLTVESKNLNEEVN